MIPISPNIARMVVASDPKFLRTPARLQALLSAPSLKRNGR